jgi:Fur family ferric uptake transcriptional regulator
VAKTKTSKKKVSPPLLPCGRTQQDHEHQAEAHHRQELKQRLEAYLAAQGLRQSAQRDRIIDLILGTTRHFSVQEIASRVRSKFPSLGPATVYRTVNLLVEAQVLRETLVDEGRQKLYEVSGVEHHDHIVCLDCGTLFEFHDEGIEALQASVSRRLGFREARHRHVIYAHCEELARKKRK